MIPLVDRITDEQLAFSNVILLFANYTELDIALHDINIWNVVGQRAIVFRDGKLMTSPDTRKESTSNMLMRMATYST